MHAFLLLLFSIALIIADHENRSFHRLRQSSEIVTLPLFYTVDIPVRAVESVVSRVETRENLLKENTKLKAENSLLQAKVQQMIAVESDNKALLQLLQTSSKTGGKVLEANIVAISIDPFIHEIVLGKGSTDGVFVGQPVVDASGVMGQIVATDSLVSRVMLITDAKSEIPVQDSRSGVRAIAVGDPGNNLLHLQDVPQTADFKQGDMLITSGLGGRYPFGYPVAKITSIIVNPNDRFSDIYAQPLAHLDRSRLVLLIWPSQPGKKLIETQTIMPDKKASSVGGKHAKK